MTDGLSLPSDTSFNSAAMRKIPISAVRLGFPGAKKISRRSGVLLFDTGGGRTRGRLTKEGGLPVRPIAEPRARKGSNNSVRGRLDGRRHAPPHRIASWEDLFENYSAYKEEHGTNVVFPAVRVTTSKKNYGRVLAAEQAVAYRGRQRGSSR